MLKENCHFYTEYSGTGGRIPCCKRYKRLGKCPCNSCNRFLNKVDAQKIIEKYTDGELISLGIIKEIRKEIEQALIDDGAMQEYTVEECLRIIDKHRAESEVSE